MTVTLGTRIKATSTLGMIGAYALPGFRFLTTYIR